MHTATAEEAQIFLDACAEYVEAIDQLCEALDQVITGKVKHVAWESFAPEQRALITSWHNGVRSARKSLRNA